MEKRYPELLEAFGLLLFALVLFGVAIALPSTLPTGALSDILWTAASYFTFLWLRLALQSRKSAAAAKAS